jgi:hypothetical protein
MLPKHACTPQSLRRIGVGIDTSRYGHYAVFLQDDLQPEADELSFSESAAGYALFRQRLQALVQRYQAVEFAVRVDVAGAYADNLLHFLHRLTMPAVDRLEAAAPLALTISCGDPQRNKNYRSALFGNQGISNAPRSVAFQAGTCSGATLYRLSVPTRCDSQLDCHGRGRGKLDSP